MVLDHHHAAEDKHLWPRLLDRGSESVAPVVHLMEGQHENIGKTIAAFLSRPVLHVSNLPLLQALQHRLHRPIAGGHLCYYRLIDPN